MTNEVPQDLDPRELYLATPTLRSLNETLASGKAWDHRMAAELAIDRSGRRAPQARPVSLYAAVMRKHYRPALAYFPRAVRLRDFFRRRTPAWRAMRELAPVLLKMAEILQ